MKFDFWTFLFQIVNFIVLLFILKRLLFKPIRNIMEKRRNTINDALSEADKKKKEAELLKRDLERELLSQKNLRAETEAKMRADVDEERKKLIEAARKDAGKTIEKEKALFESEKKKFEGDLKDRAIETVSMYASNLLSDIADEDLHRSILRKFKGEISQIASDMSGIAHLGESIDLKIITAYTLNEEAGQSIKKAFEDNLTKKISFSFETDNTLIAGIAIRADDKVYDFSLQGQMRTLAEKLGTPGT